MKFETLGFKLSTPRTVVAGYRNKYFTTKARHPHMNRELRQRVLLGYQHVEILGTCESCGEPIINLFEYETDEYGYKYCDGDCLEKALAE